MKHPMSKIPPTLPRREQRGEASRKLPNVARDKRCRSNSSAPKPTTADRLVSPIARRAPKPPTSHFKHGQAYASATYHDAEGEKAVPRVLFRQKWRASVSSDLFGAIGLAPSCGRGCRRRRAFHCTAGASRRLSEPESCSAERRKPRTRQRAFSRNARAFPRRVVPRSSVWSTGRRWPVARMR